MSSSPAPAASLAPPPATIETPAAPPAGRSLPGRLATLLFLLALFTPPLLVGDDKYWLPLFTKYLAIALFALSVDLIWGYTGLLSLGQGLYFGLGAYAVGYSLKLQKACLEAGVPFDTRPLPLPDFMAYCRLPAVPTWIEPLVNIWLAIAVALLLPTALAAFFGLLTFRLRIRGVYFSLITQALVLAAFTFVVNQQPYTGGVVGMTYLAKLELFGHQFVMADMYYLTAGILVACYLGCAALVNSKFGKVLTAIRDNEYRVLALGYNTATYKTFVFALAGALAGLSGALYVAANGTAGPEHLGIGFSIEVVILVAVGGRGTLIGAILGAVLVRLANTYINDEWGNAWPFVLGGLFIGVVTFLPEGIVGSPRKFLSMIRTLRRVHQPAL
jgi:urea transport system permease protein